MKLRRAGMRKDTKVPGRASGASTACTRVPSVILASTHGLASSSRRPAWDGQPLGQAAHGLVVRELHDGSFETAAAVEEDRMGSVDEHVGDAVASQQRLQRPEAVGLTAQLVDQGQHRGAVGEPLFGAER